jgi:hemoglobin
MSDDSPQKRTLYELIGGDADVRKLVDRFYDLMDQNPDYLVIRKLHPPSLDGSRDKLYWFLSGWMGGPDMYVERLGHPRMRMRHKDVPIGIVERDQWLSCMRLALQDTSFDEPIKLKLMEAFGRIAEAVRNKPD